MAPKPPPQPADRDVEALANFAGMMPKTDGPLVVSYPSPFMFLSYPVFAANVRILCQKDSWRNRGSSSLATTFQFIQKTYAQEGVRGVYRGGALLSPAHDPPGLPPDHRRDFEGRSKNEANIVTSNGAGNTSTSVSGDITMTKKGYRARLLTKYLIDAVCYPVLLVSTRFIIVYSETGSYKNSIDEWRQKEGLLSFFGGMAASLLSTALDEVMEWILAACIEYCSQGTDVELADKVLLKASGSSVVSVLTSPVNHLGVIQRCQSECRGLLEPEPISELLSSLPWKGTLYQVFLFGGVMALNVRLVQWKIILQQEERELQDQDEHIDYCRAFDVTGLPILLERVSTFHGARFA
eukprot:CAMPEP_0206523704 /NCGR_PEP_ID=MMETSP0324_2-20121206/67771_1 /ASSEMBLY_ACC=CAM_ASM_000836 /TAXON_ID=2866 /ORGANISM="Crypthecodinium cohnii, Strain Seligo" /LENGTH=351 /DNA_ID=CAMNT_0054018179 /DNA_START=50 /DNA_END=1102 /DNA_ORIENTATION=+